ncbi:MAG: hypothetical protein OMM_13016, partial [Candidatus Magnetoglobus multicellularis str. Araruama]
MGTDDKYHSGCINIKGNDINITDTMISLMTKGDGNAGDLSIQASSRCFLHDSNFYLDTFDLGDGGNIHIQSPLLIVENETNISARSNLPATSDSPTGKSGNIHIEMQDGIFRNGVVISAETNSHSNGGSIDIKAQNSILIESNDQHDVKPGISTSANQHASQRSGSAGNIYIAAPKLFLSGIGAVIESKTETSGTGGNIYVNADLLELKNGASISSASTNTAKNAGNAGHIFITSDDISLMNKSCILTEA